jgi:hypothetical protein
MKKENKFLKKISKKILHKDHRKKLKKVKDKEEKFESMNYLISAQLKLMLHELEIIVSQKNLEDNMFIKSRIITLPPKIKYFSQKPNNKDFKKILSLFYEIEKEVKNV